MDAFPHVVDLNGDLHWIPSVSEFHPSDLTSVDINCAPIPKQNPFDTDSFVLLDEFSNGRILCKISPQQLAEETHCQLELHCDYSADPVHECDSLDDRVHLDVDSDLLGVFQCARGVVQCVAHCKHRADQRHDWPVE